MRSARSGSVAAIAFATPLSADAFRLVGDGVGDALGAVGVGGGQRLATLAQRRCLLVLVGDGAGDALGVAGGVSRLGSVAASALATPLSADAFEDSSVMELAMRSASVRRRAARSGSVAASALRRRPAPMPSRTRR